MITIIKFLYIIYSYIWEIFRIFAELNSIAMIDVEKVAFMLDNIDDLLSLEGKELKLMFAFAKIARLDGENKLCVYINESTREKINTMGIRANGNSLALYASRLCKNGVLIRLCKGVYQINPKYICWFGI